MLYTLFIQGEGCERVKKLLMTRPRLFYQILIMCVLLVATVTLLISTTLYMNYESAITSQNAVFIQDSLEKVSNSAIFMSDWVSSIAMQIKYDNDIAMMLNQANIEPQSVSILRNRLLSLRMSSPYICSIYVFNGKTKRIYSDIGNTFEYTLDSFFDPDIFSIIDKQGAKLHLKPIPRLMKYTLDGRFEISDEVYSFVLFENISTYRPQDNTIVINVSRKWLDNAIRSLDKNTSANLIIVDQQYRVVYGAGVLPILTDISHDKTIRKAMESDKPAGYFIDGTSASRQLITYVRGTGKQADWVYLYRLPVEMLTHDIRTMQRATLLFSVLMLLIGLAGSVAYVIHVYKPINRLQRKLVELERENNEHCNIQQQEFIRSLFEQIGNENTDLKTAMKAHNIEFNMDQPMQMVLLAIDNYNRFQANYSYAETIDRRRILVGLIRKIAQQKADAIVADMKRDYFVLLISIPDGCVSPQPEILQALRGEIQSVLGDTTISCVIGRQGYDWTDLTGQYNALRSGLSQRVFAGPECSIELSGLRRLVTSGYDYPTQKEKQMCQLLILKQPTEAMQCCTDIILGVNSYGGNMLQVTLLRITSAVIEMADKLNSESGTHITYEYDTFIASLNSFETLKEITDGFSRMFHSIVDQLSSRKAIDHMAIIDRIIDGVNARYADAALTIESFEVLFNLSGIHLARLFKRFARQSFADYLRAVRLEKAKDLISTTNEPMQLIAEHVGFANATYFYTLFKKEYGMTPAEFRQRQTDGKRTRQHPNVTVSR